MKSYLQSKFIPATILCIFLLKCLIVRPNVAEAIVMLGLCSLFAFKEYLTFITKPDPNELVLNKMKDLETKTNTFAERFNEVAQDLREKLSLMVVGKQSSPIQQKKETFKWD